MSPPRRRRAASLLLAALAGIASVPPRAAAEEPRPLGPVYRERIRVALREAVAEGRDADKGRRRFHVIVGSQQVAVGAELRRMLTGAEDAEDRRAAAAGLRFLGRREAVPALAAAAAREGFATVRAEIAAALGSCGGPMARRALMDVAAGDVADRVRLAAVNALPLTGEASAPWALARTMREAGTPDGDRARAILARMGFTPQEQLELSRPAPPLEHAPKDALQEWIAQGTPELLRWVVWNGRPLPELAAALDSETAAVRRRASRTLWLREHALAGLRAERRDSYAAQIPRTIDALTDPAAERRSSARRLLAWAAQTDLGAAAEPWRTWWSRAQASWRTPPGSPAPAGTDGADSGEERR